MKLLDNLTENQTNLLATFIGTILLVLYTLIAVPENSNFPIMLAVVFSAIAAPFLGYIVIFTTIIIYKIADIIIWTYKSCQKKIK